MEIENEVEKVVDSEPKKASKKKSATKVPGKKINLNMAQHLESYEIFVSSLDEINQKKIGRKMNPEDIFSELVALIDDDFIFRMQKKSLSSEEIDDILKTSLVDFVH